MEQSLLPETQETQPYEEIGTQKVEVNVPKLPQHLSGTEIQTQMSIKPSSLSVVPLIIQQRELSTQKYLLRSLPSLP